MLVQTTLVQINYGALRMPKTDITTLLTKMAVAWMSAEQTQQTATYGFTRQTGVERSNGSCIAHRLFPKREHLSQAFVEEQERSRMCRIAHGFKRYMASSIELEVIVSRMSSAKADDVGYLLKSK